MRKTIKYVLLGLLGLVGLVVIGAVVFAMTFDPNRYKDQIERLAKERTGRTLKLAGNLEVAIWPALGAKVNGVSLTERNSAEQFLVLDSAHASVALLPLLRGEVVVDRVRVAGLKAQLVRGKDGRWNFDDLLQGQGEKPAAQKKPAPAGGEAPVRFDIAGITLERSAVGYRDLASGQEVSLSDLELSTGRIAERADGKLKFSGTAKGRNPDLDAKLQLAGQYRVDLPAKAYALSGFEAQVKGMLGKEPLEAKVSAPRLQVSADTAKGEAVSAELKMKAGERSVDAKLKLGGLEGSAKALVVPQLTADVTLGLPELPQKTLQLPITGSLRADLDKQTASADLAVKFDESNIKAKLGLAKFTPAAYVFDVDIDRLNVDRYFPPAKPPAQPAAGAKPAAAQDTPVDLSALKDLNADGKLRLGALQVRGLKLANVQAQLRAANGRAELSPHTADLYEGSLSGAISLQASGNRVTLKENLSKVAVGPLLKDFTDKDLLEGRGNIALDVSSSGGTVESIKKALGGSARLNLRDGAIKGFNLTEVMRKARNTLGRGEGGESTETADKAQRTDFTELNATFAIKNGVAHNEDLDVKAPLFRITGAGDIDIAASSIDYVTKATVVPTVKGQGGADLEQLAGVTVPVRLVGPFDALKYQVDYRSAAANIAKTRAGDKVKERVQGQREKLEERLGGRLKGLLGR
jgi:AsmA protein